MGQSRELLYSFVFSSIRASGWPPRPSIPQSLDHTGSTRQALYCPIIAPPGEWLRTSPPPSAGTTGCRSLFSVRSAGESLTEAAVHYPPPDHMR